MQALSSILLPETKKEQRRNGIYQFVMLLLIGACIGLISLLLAAATFDQPSRVMFFSYLKNPVLTAVNLLPPILLIVFFYFATGRARIAVLITTCVTFALSIANFYKIQLRDDPLMAIDLTTVTEAKNIIGKYHLTMDWKVIFAVGCAAASFYFAKYLMREPLRSRRLRVMGAAATVLAAVVLYPTVYASDGVYAATENNGNINIWSEVQVYASRGFLYPFLHSVQDMVISPPEDYQESQAKALLAAYDDGMIAEDAQINVISFMLESYTDFSKFDSDIVLKQDLYGPLHQLKEECVSGRLVDNIFGGGTKDTELCYLTGFPQQRSYRSNVNSYVRYLTQQGYYTEGFHPGEAWFYNRQNVVGYLGFDNYYFLDDFEDADQTDRYFFDKLTQLWQDRDPTVPYFNYSLSYQNHGAYETTGTGKTSYLAKGDLSDETYNMFNNYLAGIADTTEQIASFVNYFRTCEEPVVIVFFGDHLPWMGNNNRGYQELGIHLDLSTQEGFLNYYSTEYYIWANDAAKEISGSAFTGEGETIGPYYLMSELFDLCGWDGPSFLQATRSIRTLLPVIHSAGYFMENNVVTDTLTPEGTALATDFNALYYYSLTHFSD